MRRAFGAGKGSPCHDAARKWRSIDQGPLQNGLGTGSPYCSAYTSAANANSVAYNTAASMVLEVRRMKENMIVRLCGKDGTTHPGLPAAQSLNSSSHFRSHGLPRSGRYVPPSVRCVRGSQDAPFLRQTASTPYAIGCAGGVPHDAPYVRHYAATPSSLCALTNLCCTSAGTCW